LKFIGFSAGDIREMALNLCRGPSDQSFAGGFQGPSFGAAPPGDHIPLGGVVALPMRLSVATSVLAAIEDRSRRRLCEARAAAFVLQRQPHFLGAHERFANISVVRTVVEGNQPIAMPAIGLKSVADPLRAKAKDLRAFRAFDFDFIVDHESFPAIESAVCVPGLNGVCAVSLKFS
jgi:hypothetical protein